MSANKVSLTFTIGGELEINRMGYGGMQLTGTGVWGDPANRDNAKEVLQAAVKAGVNFFDTADSYGPHTNEVLIEEAIGQYYHKVDNSIGKKIVIATKGGLTRPAPGQWGPNGDPAYIRKCIEGSLQRLKVDQIDLWQLHRVDPAFPIEDTLAPVAEAVAQGKIKYVGLSETDVPHIERAQKVVPIVSVQNLYNLGNRNWEPVLDYTAQNDIAFIPWFPLASGPDKMQDKIKIALAWLLQRSSNILLIPGTSSIQHLHENIKATEIHLSEEDFASLSN
ncbi:aldo/keto reductase [Russula earlei]|uniref:Aldo/keto reductase n=1 Tax=Russula earlei TaxID=71964 RepID=A0ACC0U4L8_9AGAM|nr:aldo/keto reductase [Russula earlei]